jgi:diguanylate cyclase (GGDEF)-like protein
VTNVKAMQPIKILLIEDNPGDARLIAHMLEDAAGFACGMTWVDELAAGVAHLQSQQADVVLLDLGLPGSTGLETLQRLLGQVPQTPALVVLSGLSDEDVAMQAVQSGAQDYLIKGQVNSALLTRSIRYAIERSQAREALQRAHAELEQRVIERTAELAQTVDALHAEIAERKLAEERIRYMAHHDALTDLPNRVLLQDRVRQAIAYAQRARTRVAVLFIDLDFFKHINDSLGHEIGDRLLHTAADRLRECVREGDSVARLGGDEFVLSLSLLADGGDAATVAQKVLDALSKPFFVDGHELHVSASIGISVYPDDGTDVETLMRAADVAMYHAKEKGRRNYQFFTPALNNAVQRRLAIENRLRQALVRDELELYYQPQVDMATGKIFSAEALLRWHQPGSAPVSFGSFISIAEESGLILSIGEWVLRQACRQLKRWHVAGFTDMHIAVNLSPRQFSQPHLARTIAQILRETQLTGQSLDLEITESILLQQNDDTMATLKGISDLGIQLSVDDFGTGYSSLAYLQRFPVHALKIDQSFVRDIGRDENATTLVTAIIAMANSLHLKVLAEGVETQQQISFLTSRGCPDGQGFYYSEPLPADAFIALLCKK